MRDDMQGGILATMIAAPVVIVCCAGGGVALTAITGSVGGLLGGLEGVVILSGAAIAALTWRSRLRARSNRPDVDDVLDTERT